MSDEPEVWVDPRADSPPLSALYEWHAIATPDPALGRCQALIQCHLETGHQGGHEAREESADG
jgi:hypothetical protein